MRAFIVVDLGFGDAGKGLVTDALVRREAADVVVRFNGGAQAGHNVIAPDGRHHTFAQFGAGTFVPGVRTLLSRHVVLHPTALVREAEVLRSKGVDDALARIVVSEDARVTTPFHQAANCIRELARGDARHGSCGVGVGETVADAIDDPDGAVVAADLLDRTRLRRKLGRIAERKHSELYDLIGGAAHRDPFAAQWCVFDPGVRQRWIDRVDVLRAAGIVVSDETFVRTLKATRTAVFEGAQGVLLDETFGFHPHTTWSTCTFDHALSLLHQCRGTVEATRIGVLRSHAVRHGAGPLPTETDALRGRVAEHNRENEWQGVVRIGWFDCVLARYALQAVGGVDQLAVTHVDLLPSLSQWRLCTGYRTGAQPSDLGDACDGRGILRHLTATRATSLARQAELTALLGRVEPVLESCPSNETDVLAAIEHQLDHRIDLVSRGPRASDLSAR